MHRFCVYLLGTLISMITRLFKLFYLIYLMVFVVVKFLFMMQSMHFSTFLLIPNSEILLNYKRVVT